MKILITGGNTAVHIDKVRIISNIFKGKTACDITYVAACNMHECTLIGNENMRSVQGKQFTLKEPFSGKTFYHPKFLPYKTYDELYSIMENEIKNNKYDVIIHSAAVSDYRIDGIFTKDSKHVGLFQVTESGKISSSYGELYLKLTPTKKIVDQIRNPWGFTGKLIKFKLQVDMPDLELIEIARKSRVASGADYIVANCLEWAKERAYILSDKDCISIERNRLPHVLMDLIENG